MDALRDPGAEDAARLRARLNDLVSVTEMRALWAGAEPTRIAATLLDALLGMLHAAFVFIRMNGSEGGGSIQMARIAESLKGAIGVPEICDAIDSSLGGTTDWPSRGRLNIGKFDLRVASARLGLDGEIGGILAGCQRDDFPVQAETLLLIVGADQATIGLQQTQRTRQPARANEALSDSESESRLIVDSIPGFVATFTPAGQLEFVNGPSLEYFGKTLEELQGWASGGMTHPEDLPRVLELFTHSITSGDPFALEVRARRFDGVYRWFQSRGFPLRDSKGHIVRWYALLIDIDDRKRAEEALAASERNLTLIVDTIPAMVWRGTPEGELDYLNQRAVEYLGQTAQSLSGGRWLELIHPDHRDTALRRWLQSASTGSSYEDVYQLRRADGEYRWIQSVGEPFHDMEGRIAHWYGLVVDIEDRKRAEMELRRAYDSFSDAQRLSKTGSFITDLVGDDHNWSEEAYRVFEFDPATKVTVQRVRDVIHPDDLPAFESVIARAMTGENVTFAFRIVTEGDAVKHVRGVAHVREQVEGRPMFIGALQDVTQSVIADEALNRARSELAHVARAATVSTLTASIAHEVSQPLSGILTNAGTCLRMLAGDPPNVDGARETAKRTIRDANRASDVITRLRALFSKKEFTLESLDVNDATREVIALSMGDLQRHRVVVQTELDEELPKITGDRIQLQQVILNLVRNATEAMVDVDDRPRQLLVRTERENDDRVRITVRDSGVGLDRDNVDKLFDAFHTTKSGGMGIGLSVSRSIVERHHGRLWAEPNEGPGATFSLSIPCSLQLAARD